MVSANYFSVNLDDSATSYTLHNSFILDSGATIHCCNTRERFYALKPAAADNILIAGNDYIQIEAFGDVYITVEGLNRLKQILLRDVAYVLSFYTSVASLYMFIKQNVY